MRNKLPNSEYMLIEKHRPKSLNEFVGITEIIDALKEWAEIWNSGELPEKRAVLLYGPPGTGKTSLAYALANDNSWELIEMNASDARNKSAINNIALRGALYNTFSSNGTFLKAEEGKHKLILLDEADNLYERIERSKKTLKDASVYDSGGISAIIETIKRTRQPIILTVNDLQELKRKNFVLIKLCLTLEFKRYSTESLMEILRKIVRTEKAKVDLDTLRKIIKNSNGDVRSAINDLEMVINGFNPDILDSRNVEFTIFEGMKKIFYYRTLDVPGLQKELFALEEPPENLLLWIDENLPRIYTHREDLFNAYNYLSRADIFLGRIMRRQYYRFWAYARDLMTAGVAVSRQHGYAMQKFNFPLYLAKLSRFREQRALLRSTSFKLAKYLHTSTSDVATSVLPFIKKLAINDIELRVNLIRKISKIWDDVKKEYLAFTDEEIAELIDRKDVDDPNVKKTVEYVNSSDDSWLKTIFSDTRLKETGESEPEEKEMVRKKPQKSLFDF